jgi:hypothetical protein
MNIKAFVLGTLLGVSAPMLVDSCQNYAVNAQSATAPIGVFSNGNLSVSLWYENNAYHYFAYQENSRYSVQLSGARLDQNSNQDRKVFIWYNGNAQYQIAWRPSDPNFVRVIVINSDQQIETNTILARENVYF